MILGKNNEPCLHQSMHNSKKLVESNLSPASVTFHVKENSQWNFDIFFQEYIFFNVWPLALKPTRTSYKGSRDEDYINTNYIADNVKTAVIREQRDLKEDVVSKIEKGMVKWFK